ncbi:MAG: GspE/PulE family protein [Lachnospiraceae bacterium]
MADFRQKKRIGDMLLEAGIITQEQLEDALEKNKTAHKKIGEMLVDLGYATEEAIGKGLATQLNIPFISLHGMKIEDDIIKLADGKLLRKHLMIPFEYKEGNVNIIRVAMADPMDMRGIDDFSIITNLQVEPVIATTHDILVTLDKYYGDSEAKRVAEQYAKERESQKTKEEQAEDEDVANSPIVQLVKSMIEQAARQRASDIHIEPMEDKVRVRYRIDGVLYEKSTYHINLLSAIITRVKIIGNMDISEKRRPQDGRITMMIDRKEYDIRASILPTVYGEKCVMRLAQKKALTRDKRSLGFTEQQLQMFDEMLNHPNGIILVTGPTGSGKSTTLYTAVNERNHENINIITVEDPVEANVDGVSQVQVNAKADLTFASALRSILRQDPDVIMIGEIRDRETASIAVQASITGHLVLSTLHTNDAPGTMTRLMDMGVESYLLADAMRGVIAQRLVRRLCPHCKKKRKALGEEKSMMGINPMEEIEIYEPVGCEHCNDTGFYGRTGIYEMMPITSTLRNAIAARMSTDEIREVAVKEGMNTLHSEAVRLVLEGETSYHEMIRVSLGE